MDKSKTCNDCKYFYGEKGKINLVCISCRKAYFDTHERVDKKDIMFEKK